MQMLKAARFWFNKFTTLKFFMHCDFDSYHLELGLYGK